MSKDIPIYKRIADRTEELFLEEIEKKNSWGKNEIKQLYKDCKLKSLQEYILEQ